MSTVGNGQNVTSQQVTSGNTLEVQSGGTANATQVDNGGTLQIDAGGTETGAIVEAGGTETVAGQSGGDDDFGTINVNTAGGVAGSAANPDVVENGGTLELTIKGAAANYVTVKSGGTLTISGNAPANNVTLQGGTLELESPKADTTNTGSPTASGSLTFASGSSSRLQIDVAQTGSNGTAFAQTISGYGGGDVIDLKYLTATGATVTQTASGANTVVTVTGGGSSGSETFTFLNTTPGHFATAADPTAGGVDLVETACYVTGTAIRTTRGDVAIEALVVGDLVVTASGATRPIRWIGHRDVDCTAHPVPSEVWPVRIRAGAFGVGGGGDKVPERDLYLSPGHPVLVGDGTDAHLVPIMCLINGTSIERMEAPSVTYWHVELDEHDILLAEDLPAESFLDFGNRPWFGADAAAHALANPDFVPAGLGARCRPVAVDGPLVAAERRRLDALFAASLATASAWPKADGWSIAF